MSNNIAHAKFKELAYGTNNKLLNICRVIRGHWLGEDIISPANSGGAVVEVDLIADDAGGQDSVHEELVTLLARVHRLGGRGEGGQGQGDGQQDTKTGHVFLPNRYVSQPSIVAGPAGRDPLEIQGQESYFD